MTATMVNTKCLTRAASSDAERGDESGRCWPPDSAAPEFA